MTFSQSSETTVELYHQEFTPGSHPFVVILDTDYVDMGTSVLA